MLALVVALGVTGAWGDVDEDAPRPKQAEERVERARSSPERKEQWSPGATKRFAGALLGGAVGAVVPALVGLAARPVCTFCGTPPLAVAMFLMTPVLAAVGTLVGWSLLGGSASVGAAAAGALAGMVAALVLLIVPAATFQRDVAEAQFPFIVGVTGLAVALETLALEAREAAVEETPALATPTGRFLATSLTMLGTLVVGTALVVGITAASRSAAVAVPATLVTLALAPLAPWAMHQALDGRGSVGFAYLGMLASAALVTGSVLAGALTSIGGAFGPRRDARLDAGLVLAFSAGGLAGVFGVPLLLEYSHGREVLERAQKLKATLSVAPVPGGVMAGVALQF
jgi:MFS family permease